VKQTTANICILVVGILLGSVAGSSAKTEATRSAKFPTGTPTHPAFTPAADFESPYMTGIYPEPGSTGVNLYPLISFHLRDNGNGVNLSTLQFLVEGRQITNYEVTGDLWNYTITYETNGFRAGQIVDVRVSVNDFSQPPNEMSNRDWWFLTRGTTPTPTRTAVPPSGTPTYTRTPTAPPGTATPTPTVTATMLPDDDPPYAANFDPPPGSVGVAPDAVIHFDLLDDINGVDASWVQVTYNGQWTTAQLSGTPQHYAVTCDPSQQFPVGQEVMFVINALDLSRPANWMRAEYYSFVVATATPRPTATPTPTPFPETDPPFVIYPNPEPGEVGVDRYADITFYVCDDGNGVDESSIVVMVAGYPCYTYWSGTPACYFVEAYPYYWPYDYGQIVDVEIDAQDLSYPPNVMDTFAYTFTVATHSSQWPTGTPTRTPTRTPTPPAPNTPTRTPTTIPSAPPTPPPTEPPDTPTPAEPPTDTPAPSPPPPTVTPTDTPATPTPSPTPNEQPGVQLYMPAQHFSPGDVCWLSALLNNPGQPITRIPLVILLDIGVSEYWFWPSWTKYPSNFDYQDVCCPQGETAVPVILPFAWPDTADGATGLTFYGALLTSDLTAIAGDMGQWQFSYGPR